EYRSRPSRGALEDECREKPASDRRWIKSRLRIYKGRMPATGVPLSERDFARSSILFSGIIFFRGFRNRKKSVPWRNFFRSKKREDMVTVQIRNIVKASRRGSFFGFLRKSSAKL